MNDKDAAQRNKLYDMKKAQKGYGVAFIVIGAASAVSMRVKTQMGFVIYLVVVIVSLAASVCLLYTSMFATRQKPSRVDRGVEVMRVDNLSDDGMVKNVDFNLYKGEILGFFGLVGACLLYTSHIRCNAYKISIYSCPVQIVK